MRRVLLEDGEAGAILGNRIGVTASGNEALRNEGYGVNVQGTTAHNVIGETQDTRNIISGNAKGGILVDGSQSVTSENYIGGNYIGLGSDGMTVIGNGVAGHGISINDSAENVVGGKTDAQRNVISGTVGVGLA